MSSKTKVFSILLIVLIIMTGIRLSWIHLHKPADLPSMDKGVLDLTDWSIPEDRIMTLSGEWEFYPNQLLTSIDDLLTNSDNKSKPIMLQVPGVWNEAFDHNSTFRYGTYRLQLKIDELNSEVLSLRVYKIVNASNIYINGQHIAGAGNTANTRALHQAKNMPYTVNLPEGLDSIEIMVQVSSHEYNGGITKPILFGTSEAVIDWTNKSQSLQLILCVIFLINGLYALSFFFLGAPSRGLYYFTIIMICAIMTVLVADDRILYEWIPYSYELSVKISLLTYNGVVAFIPPLLIKMFPQYGNARVVKWFTAYCLAYALFVLIAPAKFSLAASPILLSSVLLLAVAISTYILQLAVRKEEDVIFLLLGCISLGSNIFWVVFLDEHLLGVMFYPFELALAVFGFACFWFRRFFQSNKKTMQLAEKLQLANKQKDDFLINTSHELRNPLHSILSISQLMLEDQTIDHTHKKRLDVQVSVARRMSLLLDDLIDVARLKENNIRLQLTNVKLQSVIAGILELFKFMMQGKPLSLQVQISDDFPAVRADENRLVHILYNLLHNAIKFTDEGSIYIRAEIKNDMANIFIQDTGIGMDEQLTEKIFEPYEQGETSINRAIGGFGLGLSICKQLVELHGGSISVTSSPNQGSTFTFTLPLGNSTELNETAVAKPSVDENTMIANQRSNIEDIAKIAANLEKPRVLIVDDDNINLQIINDILYEANFEVSTANSGNEAISLLEQIKFDLVVTDVMMPHISGYELTRMIRERFSISELPILLLTAKSRPEAISAGFEAGANDYVTKPADASVLRSRAIALTDLKLSIDERMRIEAAWLQAQIQPHFLFNTLNSIASLGTTDISKMQMLLEQFSNYLRTSFDFHNTSHVVSLKHELELVKSYLYIQKERFGKRLKIEWNVDSNLPLWIPPLSIQTLVENAVNHGVMHRSKGGTVIISIIRNADFAEISIADDGVGIPDEILKKLLHKTKSSHQRVGLRNTDRRLKQIYGKGLQISSSPERGTIVTFQVPCKDDINTS